jgi:hypothetical protein
MRSLKEAVAELQRAPESCVVAEVEGVVVELRIPKRRTADDIFQEVGTWEGETAEELSQLLRGAREQGGSKRPPGL